MIGQPCVREGAALRWHSNGTKTPHLTLVVALLGIKTKVSRSSPAKCGGL